MIVEALVVAGLVAAWVGAGHVDRAAPVRAGISGAARAGVTTGWTVARARWADGADARAGRRAARDARWGSNWVGRAALATGRATGGVLASVGRGVAVVGPAVASGARAARLGWAAGYRAERNRRAGIEPTSPGPIAPPDRGGVGPGAPTPPGPASGPEPGGTEPEPPAPAGPQLTVVPDTNGDTPVTNTPMDAEITDLTTLSAVLASLERIAEEMANVSQAAKQTHLLAACEFAFDPGTAARAALDAASEVAPQWFDADAWHSQVVAARQAVDAVQQQATELTDTGARGHTDALAAS